MLVGVQVMDPTSLQAPEYKVVDIGEEEMMLDSGSSRERRRDKEE
jgi:hypothetical protein